MESGAKALEHKAWQHYTAHGRHDLPWRQPAADGSFDPYAILVSEFMLQQTQVGRVLPKYQEFLARFPSIQELAAADLGDVLRVWQGLGYNRRAKYIWQTAQRAVHEYSGVLPSRPELLRQLPGIGANTAGAISAYAWDIPAVFIETNIRTAVIYHCYRHETAVTEQMIQRAVAYLVARQTSPRVWYWALMDYGTYLKQTVGNLNKLSDEYVKQSTFHGSRRQLRGEILRMLSKDVRTHAELTTALPDQRTPEVLDELCREQLVRKTMYGYTL